MHQRVLRWLLLHEKYGPEFVYIKDIHNVTDAMSCLNVVTPELVKDIPMNLIHSNNRHKNSCGHSK